jgi:hypothetical protein
MPKRRKTNPYRRQTEEPKYLECELIKILNNKEIELSRLKLKDKTMETTINQLNRKLSDKNTIPLLKPNPIMVINNGTDKLEIYPHSKSIKTTTKIRGAIKEFMLK